MPSTPSYLPLDELMEIHPPQYLFLSPPRAEGELGWLAHYRVLKVLGHGGMGVVFQAEDSELGRMVALKVMPPGVAQDSQTRETLLREARAMARIQHNNVVMVHQVGEERGVPYLAMELLKGCTLGDWLERGHRPTMSHILRIGREAALGIGAAHAVGVIHRDLKPGNLWLEAPHGRVKILDFGLARCMEEDVRLTFTGMVVGTPAYIAPEQARTRNYDHRADLFSLGCILYELCAGQRAFHGETAVALIMASSMDTPIPLRQHNPEVTPALAELIERLMAKDPNERPDSAQFVADELASMLRCRLSGLRMPIDPNRVAAQSLPVTPRPLTYAPTEILPAVSLPTPRPLSPATLPDVPLTLPQPSAPDTHAAAWKVGVIALAIMVLLLGGVAAMIALWYEPSPATATRALGAAGWKGGLALAQERLQPMPSDRASDHLNQICTIELEVASITGQMRAYLNNRETEKASTFAAIVSEECLQKLRLSMTQAKHLYQGKRLLITGRVTDKHRDPKMTATYRTPHIFVDDPSQMLVLE